VKIQFPYWVIIGFPLTVVQRAHGAAFRTGPEQVRRMAVNDMNLSDLQLQVDSLHLPRVGDPQNREYSSRSCIGSLRGTLSGTNDVPKRLGGHYPTDGKERQINRRQSPRKRGQPTTNPEEP
jgi:hypothetical protein